MRSDLTGAPVVIVPEGLAFDQLFPESPSTRSR
jgi:hypothetical protein